MTPTFSPTPNKEAVALIAGKSPVSAKVFYGLLPELRARAFTVSGLEGANVLQRVRDAIAALPQGIGEDGESYTWDTQKKEIEAELEPFLGEEGAANRAQTLLRTSGFQAFSSTIWNIAQADDDTTHLQYIHGDQAKDPTPSHEALDGIILPKDDPFWDTHTGPWGHLGCVCYVRPMNPDLVDEARAQDAEQKNPEDRNVLEGPAATQLQNGTLMRNGRRHDVSPPDDPGAFRWHPDDLRLPLAELKLRYDPEVWTTFELWSRKTLASEKTTVWNWLSSKPFIEKPTRTDHTRIDRQTIDRQREIKNRKDHIGDTGTAVQLGLGDFRPSDSLGTLPRRILESRAKARLADGITFTSTAGTKVSFAKVLQGHVGDKPDQRARFLPHAELTAIAPIEIWQDGLRRRYIGRFKDRSGTMQGFVVVTARKGEYLDEVITFFPKSGRALKRMREGELIYRK